MGVEETENIACRGGFGERVTRGKERVAELECQAKCFRERLKHLEALLPDNALQRQDKHRDDVDFLEEDRSEDSGVCILQTLANKEKSLREQVYDMERTEKLYLNTLKNVGGESAKIETKSRDSQPETKDGEDNTWRTDDSGISSTNRNTPDVKKRIQRLETYGKKLCINLRSSRKNCAELSQEAEIFTRELDRAREELGLRCETLKKTGKPCEPFTQDCRENCPEKFEHLSAGTSCLLSSSRSSDDNDCPCGSPVKCNSCTVCYCSEWEKDLQGGTLSSAGSGDEAFPSKRKKSRNARRRRKENDVAPSTKTQSCQCDPIPNNLQCTCSLDVPSEDDETICHCYESDLTTLGVNSSTSVECNTDFSDVTIIDDDDFHGPPYFPIICPKHSVVHECQCPALAPRKETCDACIGDRCRGGVDKNEFVLTATHLVDCSCQCDICALRDPGGLSPPCHHLDGQKIVEEIPNDADVRDENVPTEIYRLCNIDKLREALEQLKNRNHALRKLLGKDCDCSDANAEGSAQDRQARESIDELITTVKILQSKCRTKDGMIVVLANELNHVKDLPERTNRILRNLADPELGKRTYDFDRSTLWRYLESHTVLREAGTIGKDLPFGLLVLILLLLSRVLSPIAGETIRRLRILFSQDFRRIFPDCCISVTLRSMFRAISNSCLFTLDYQSITFERFLLLASWTLIFVIFLRDQSETISTKYTEKIRSVFRSRRRDQLRKSSQPTKLFKGQGVRLIPPRIIRDDSAATT